MEFSQPQWLYLLLVIPAYGLFVWFRRRHYPGLTFSNTKAIDQSSRGLRVYVSLLPALLRICAIALCILALARPQTRDVTQEQYAEGLDIILVLDTSTSMRAEDFKPNRFEAARDVASDFIDGRISDRIGLIVFAAKAYTQAPLTLDYQFLQSMLSEVKVGAIQDGTAIGTALATAVNRLKDTVAESKVIILLTDGQNNRGEIDPVTASEVAATLGVRIYAIGVGTYGEAPFYVDSPFGGRQRQMVPVEIDEDMLRSITDQTDGQYFRATNEQALREIYATIGELETTEIETRIYTGYEDHFNRFLLPGLILVLLEILLRTTYLRRFP
ncbi:MAG: VWA domain-containing protein [Bacteroidetes bacterium]|nr:VWA domain-containing protein [Bacteroidota bacterium]